MFSGNTWFIEILISPEKKKASIYIPLMEVNCRRQQESTLKGHFEINIYFMLMYAFILNHLVDNLSKAIYSVLKVQFTFNQFEWFQRNHLAVASFMLKSQAKGNMYSIPQLHVYGVCFDKPQHLYRLKQNNEGFHKTRNLTRGGGVYIYINIKKGEKQHFAYYREVKRYESRPELNLYPHDHNSLLTPTKLSLRAKEKSHSSKTTAPNLLLFRDLFTLLKH